MSTSSTPDVKTLPADADYELARGVWSKMAAETGQEVTALELFSHPGAKRNQGTWIIGPADQVRAYVDLHPQMCADYRDATTMLRDRIW